MATRQQLRGDGSKEYQIITNLSRGINNAVADDVLVDNSFRDVVNFSSDQLGNISKRDNLINSNFKEFIRKLAYGDFDLNRFKIKKYTLPEDGYKMYSFSSIDQIILQSFYEMLFTNKPYRSNDILATLSGVAKSNNGELYKVPTYIGAPTINTGGYLYNKGFDYQDIDTDEPIKNYTDRQKSNILEIQNSQTTSKSDGSVTVTKTLSWKDEETDEIVKIAEINIPEGWSLQENNTQMYKEYIFSTRPNYYIEDITVVLDNIYQTEIKTSVGFYVQTDTATNYTANILTEVNDNSYDVYIYNSNVTFIGVDGDYGWEVVDKMVSSQTYKALHKSYLKSDIIPNTVKKIKLLGTVDTLIDYAYDIILYFSNLTGIKNPNYYRLNPYFVEISNVTLNKVFVLSQDNFFKQLQNLDQLFGENSYVNGTLEKSVSFEAWFISIGDFSAYRIDNTKPEDVPVVMRVYDDTTSTTYATVGKCLVLHKLKFELDTDLNIHVSINSRTLDDDYLIADTDTKVMGPAAYQRFMYAVNYDEDVLQDVFISKYSNSLYITTGSTALIQIALDASDSIESIKYIGAFNDIKKLEPSGYIDVVVSNIYSPVPYEVNNPGFNLLAENPINAIEAAGSVDKIRGVFYTLSGRISSVKLVQNVPCNIPFYIHIISTGSSKPNVPKIRPNNGELDEAKNPYTDLPGSWETTYEGELPIYKCTGIDSIESYEMKITMGNDDYITYFTPEPYVEKEEDYIGNVRNLLLNCSRSKIINNQLLLFGNAGYIFFSDFDNFRYFPNYYYIYVPTDLNEKIIDIVYFRQFYAIFTNKRIFRMSGDFAADNFEIGPLNDFMGCVNHSTIRQVYNSLYFIGYNGIYALNQGYLGTGTENLKRIDTQLTNTFNFDNVAYCYVMSNIYIIVMKDGKTWYTYDVDNDMFLRYDYSLGDNSTLSNISFIETLEENQIYAILSTNKEGKGYADDLLLYNFPLSKDVNYSYKDSDKGYISSFETPYINLGTPTNTKKFKNLFIKMYNETDSLIPLYVTVYVDDILAITPEDYTIELDEETNTYYYYFKVDNNAELLKAHNLLGELTLGKDTLGDNIIQQLKLKINAKGRAIKIILADGYDYPNKDNSAIIKYRNNKKFSISTIGIVYKLKKVKEG